MTVEAGRKALADANVQAGQIEAFYLGNFAAPGFVGQNHLAPYIAGALGMAGIPATRFEAACASSGSAFFHAVMAVAILGVCIPTFVTAPLLVLGLASKLGWFPTAGWNDGALANLVLPVTVPEGDPSRGPMLFDKPDDRWEFDDLAERSPDVTATRRENRISCKLSMAIS